MSTFQLSFILPGGGELWIILAILLVLFGAKKLPELARSMGSSVTQFKKGLREEPGDSGRLDPPGDAKEPGEPREES